MSTVNLLKRRHFFVSSRRNIALACLLLPMQATVVAQQPSPAVVPRSGIEYASADIRAMQADDFANPGMLWVTRGEKLWKAVAGGSHRACADCHGAAEKSMRGAATRYPRMNAAGSRLINLEGRINQCRVEQQAAEPLGYESDELLALTAYVAHQSRGMVLAVTVDEGNRAHYRRGREIYYRRQGQMNLACMHCHERNAGRKLLAETISEGHGNAYPAYRLEWQSTGSLHRRLRACYFGVRAEMPAFGGDELLDLEFYLAQRANGLAVETPGVRR